MSATPKRTPGAVQFGVEARDTKPPLVFSVGESPEVTVYEPDAGTMMALTSAGGDPKLTLQLLLGSEWPKISEHLEPLHYEVILEIIEGIGEHFKLADFYAPPAANRAERRRRRSSGR